MSSIRLFFYKLLTSMMPPTRLFGLKRSLLRWSGATVGENVRIASSVRFYLSGDLVIGKNTWIGHECLVMGGDSVIEIGSDVDIAPRVTIVSGTHTPNGARDKAAGPGLSLPIIIEDGCWIGVCSTILGGVTIGRQSIVGASSLVNKSIPPKSTAVGVPARTLDRDSSEGKSINKP